MRRSIPFFFLAAGLAGLAWTAPLEKERAPAANTPPSAADAGSEFFEKKIRPVLVEHCYECHSGRAKEPKGGLLLDSRAGTREGGDSGPAIVPGKPEDSLLLKAIRHSGELKMPPKRKLPGAIIADLEAWVKMGAPDPRDKPAASTTAATWEEMLKNRRQWWSLQPVRRQAVPHVKNAAWSSHPVDRFVLSKLEEKGLGPAPPADPRTLIRRLSLVLTGLPPTPAEIDQFLKECGVRSAERGVKDEHPGGANSALRIPHSALERLVDRLLASPHFGERWARHWLDVVRFSETHGNEWNYEVHHAWRYRDYLIRAFNQDVPCDQLVREHIAGDLLPSPRWNRERFNESVIGTAFYRFGEVNHDDCIGLRQIGFDLADNQIDALSKAFLATTVACARCHDHKLDAVSMQDYYALLGVLRSSRLVSHTIDAPETNAAAMRRLGDLKRDIRQALGEIWLREARDIGRYLLAAQNKLSVGHVSNLPGNDLDAKRFENWLAALKAEKQPLEDPLEPWRMLRSARVADAAAFAAEWRKVAQTYAKADRERTELNKRFTTFADFSQCGVRSAECGVNGVVLTPHSALRTPHSANWSAGGHGLRQGLARSGDFALHHDGESLVRAILPAGCFTHALSDKLNGTLRSAVLPQGIKHISFQVMGQRSSALRLVSNNCQLNYKNYRALTSSDLQWITFSPPEDSDSLRVYAELMTMLDNPKFPDQLAALGGDKENYRLPWEKAAANPRSFFGITQVVVHERPEPPHAELGHLKSLFGHTSPTRQRGTGLESPSLARRVSVVDEPRSLADLAARYTAIVEAAARAWAVDRASDDEVRWLDALLQRGLLSNGVRMTPRLEGLVSQYRDLERQLVSPRIVPGIADFGPGFDQPVLLRGDCNRPGEQVPRRFLEVLSAWSGHSVTGNGSRSDPATLRFTSPGSGRLELANRIASPNNPLTARVIVNRIWHHLFGTGLVRTVDDFGRVGELPSHPELLDYLADRFVQDGWSIKRLIRTLVLSETFRMSSRPSPTLARSAGEGSSSVPSLALRAGVLDPHNRLLWHFPARRMEAEAIRDSILAVSGRLDRRLFGMSVQPYRERENADRRLFPGPLDGDGRRSVYIKNNLMESPRFLSAFDFPGGKVTQGRRDVTNVPAQALALLNDPFVLQQADVWAAHCVTGKNQSRSDPHIVADEIASRIEHMFLTALCRRPDEEERKRFERAVAQFGALHKASGDQLLKSEAVWKDVAHVLLNLQEFIYIR